MNDTKYHIIDLRKENYGGQELNFSIDFEPVQLIFDDYIYKKYYSNIKLEEWQDIINHSCEFLGKEPRRVYARRENDKIHISDGKMLLEFVSEGRGYNQYMYFMETKRYYFNNFHNYYKLYAREKSELWQMRKHYDMVYKYLQEQGLFFGKQYYEPSIKVIDKFLELINKDLQNG